MKKLLILHFIFSPCFSFAQWTTSGSIIYNTNTGNVGIGTSTPHPDAKLNIYNSGAATQFIIGNPSTGSGGYTALLIGTSANTGGFGFIDAIKSSGSAHGNVIISRFGGNVGIGTTTPGTIYKLAVAGKVAATGEVRVFTDGTTTFPDYVFDPAYKLPSLAETEKYVKENRHLPEVPSAADIEKDGMSLNGMNTILLKKVEELTLYMIEMKKENETLKARMSEIEKKNK